VDLAGVVRDSGGTPLPDALVIAWPMGRRGPAVVQARSDEEGRFVLPGLRPGTWTLLAEASGFGTLEREMVVPAPEPGELVLSLEGRSHTLEGVVMAAGLARPEARVVLGGPGLRWPRATTAGRRGAFAFAGLGLGKVVVRATHGRQVSQTASHVIEEDATKLPRLRLELSPGSEVEGRVLDDQGRPLAGAVVDVLTVPSDELPATGRSDAEGRYQVGPVAPGHYQIIGRMEGHVLLSSPEPRLAAGRKASFDLRLARGARISGRVVDEQGKPLASVPVSVVTLIGGRDELAVIPGALPTAAEAAELPPGAVSRQGSMRTTSTNLLGEFTLAGLAPGPARIEATHPDKLPFRREPLLLVPGETRELEDAVLLAGVSLVGRVLQEDGQPIKGARIEARPTGRLVRLPVYVASDAQGEFALRVPGGEYSLRARAAGFELGSLPVVRALTGLPRDPIELRLRRQAAPGGMSGMR
jgi:protocatechuate 3,4-dioxygenase beta subunit